MSSEILANNSVLILIGAMWTIFKIIDLVVKWTSNTKKCSVLTDSEKKQLDSILRLVNETNDTQKKTVEVDVKQLVMLESLVHKIIG